MEHMKRITDLYSRNENPLDILSSFTTAARIKLDYIKRMLKTNEQLLED